MSISLLGIILIAILIYLIFYVIPTPPVLRNILAITLVIILFAVLLNLLGVLSL